jgi:hypothetical protein
MNSDFSVAPCRATSHNRRRPDRIACNFGRHGATRQSVALCKNPFSFQSIFSLPKQIVAKWLGGEKYFQKMAKKFVMPTTVFRGNVANYFDLGEKFFDRMWRLPADSNVPFCTYVQKPRATWTGIWRDQGCRIFLWCNLLKRNTATKYTQMAVNNTNCRDGEGPARAWFLG